MARYHNTYVPDYFLSSDEDFEYLEEYKREFRFIKHFLKEEKKTKGVPFAFFPRLDFQMKKMKTFPEPEFSSEKIDLEREVSFTDYTIWERLPVTEERQKYLDQWNKDYAVFVENLKAEGAYKARRCMVTRPYGHRRDKCPYYHTSSNGFSEDKDEKAAQDYEAKVRAHMEEQVKICEELEKEEQKRLEEERIQKEKEDLEAAKQKALVEQQILEANRYRENIENAKNQLDRAIALNSSKRRRNRGARR